MSSMTESLRPSMFIHSGEAGDKGGKSRSRDWVALAGFGVTFNGRFCVDHRVHVRRRYTSAVKLFLPRTGGLTYDVVAIKD